MAKPEPGSPEWWLRRLHAELLNRRPHIRKLEEYYDGDHPLAFASEKFREAFGGLFREFADNWCDLVVDAVEERLNVVGFRTGGPDSQPDTDAWAMWQRNQMDAQSQMGHTATLTCGTACATAWFGADDLAELTVEHPHDAVVITHPKRRRERLAGLRLYADEWGFEHAELFLPNEVYLYKSRTARATAGIVDAHRVQWDSDYSVPDTEDGVMPNPLGVVPMVELPNRPRLRPSRHGLGAQSELAHVIPIQNAINKLVADMMVGAEYTAMPQRVATGMEIKYDDANQPINPFTADKRVWQFEDETAKFHQFDAGNITNYVAAIGMLVQHLASITRTPPHYLSANADRLSGESIKAAETGLVAKARRKMVHLGEAWEELVRLGGRIEKNDALANATSAETIWADPESRTESEHIDAVGKKRKLLDVPRRQAWEDAGYTPTQITRMEAWLEQEQLDAELSALNAPQPTPAPQPQPT